MNSKAPLQTQQEYNDLVRKTISELEVEINQLLPENSEIDVIHISHQLQHSSIPHFRQYDRTKYKGMTIALVKDKKTLETSLYSYLFPFNETFSRIEGRLNVLRNLRTNLSEKKEGLITRRFEPVLVDLNKAFKHLKSTEDNQKTLRSIVDWYITNYVNEAKSVKAEVQVTRQVVSDFEASLLSQMEDQLNNKVKLHFSYEYNVINPDFKGSRTPPDKSTIRVEIKDKKELDESSLTTLKEGLEFLTSSVTRYVNDPPNRLLARLALLNLIAKQI